MQNENYINFQERMCVYECTSVRTREEEKESEKEYSEHRFKEF